MLARTLAFIVACLRLLKIFDFRFFGHTVNEPNAMATLDVAVEMLLICHFGLLRRQTLHKVMKISDGNLPASKKVTSSTCFPVKLNLGQLYRYYGTDDFKIDIKFSENKIVVNVSKSIVYL
jgi:hypothetical protein